MAFATEGFQSIAQNFISRGIASFVYPKLNFLSAIAGIQLGNNRKQPLEIGRPGVGEIISGGQVSPAERLTLGSVNRYRPRIQAFTTSNSKWMGARDTRPTVSSPTTASHGQAMQATADFGWAKLVTPIMIWHEDKERALQNATKDGQGLAMSKLVDEATEVALQEHVDALNTAIWTGNPASQTADPWNICLGIDQIMSASNVYGNVDRSVSANSAWRAQLDSTTTTVDIVKLIDTANLGGTYITKGLRVYGDGADLCVTTTSLYAQFKTQILNSGGVVLQNGMPKMGELGVKTEVLKKDNVYITYDVTQTANYVDFWTTKTLKLMFHPQHNLKVTPFVDLSDKAEGAKEADQAFISTKFMFTCDNPQANARFSAIGT